MKEKIIHCELCKRKVEATWRVVISRKGFEAIKKAKQKESITDIVERNLKSDKPFGIEWGSEENIFEIFVCDEHIKQLRYRADPIKDQDKDKYYKIKKRRK